MNTPKQITLTVYPLYKGSKNPPRDTKVLIKVKDGGWGYGDCFMCNKKLYFNFYSPTSTFLGEPKETFESWMTLPE